MGKKVTYFRIVQVASSKSRPYIPLAESLSQESRLASSAPEQYEAALVSGLLLAPLERESHMRFPQTPRG